MGLLRGIGRAAPVIGAGLAGGWYLRRQGLLGGPGRPELTWEPEAAEPPIPEPAEEETRQEPEPIEAHVEAVEAVSDAADVTAVVEDLLAAAPGQEIVDAVVVEEGGETELVEVVRMALAEVPGLMSGAMRVEAAGGIVWLRGQLERSEAIAEAERRAEAVPGVTEVRNELHLPGTPPPRGP